MDILYSFDLCTESWIEVASRPSSSSLSSAAADEPAAADPPRRTVTTCRRRRTHRLTNIQSPQGLPARPLSAAGSSQEEYEESESESDRILSSSNEDLLANFQQHLLVAPSSNSEAATPDQYHDENLTALGIAHNEPVFTPQPNAFSHPPSRSLRQPQSAGMPDSPDSYFPTQRTAVQPTRSIPQHNLSSPRRVRSHTPFNVIAPSFQADHDAALRASLSTLLSCAAAARALPKRDQQNRTQNTVEPPSRITSSTLRIVPESVVLATSFEKPYSPPPRRLSLTTSSSAHSVIQAKLKRKSASRDRRESKKKRRDSSGGVEIGISPTLMTWVVSAGVVVLFSAISFSAGFAYGREVGQIEAGVTAGASASGSVECGREVGRGLRRFRWGNASVVRV